jgi:hypothetical protein
MRHFRSYRWVGAAVAAIGLFAAAVAGQPPRPATPPDPIDAAKAQQRIAEQKAEADILQTIENADRLAKGGHVAKAAQTLKTAKQNLQAALGIGDTARTKFTTMLDAKLAAVEGRAVVNPNTNPGVKLDPKGAEVKAANAETVAKYFAELKDVREGIKKIETAQTLGRTAEANDEIARLAKNYPYNPSVLALGQKDTMQNRLADAQAHYVESSRRWVENQKSINRSSLPAINEIEFPANWKELSARRLKSSGTQMTEKEKKIVEALDKPMTVNFADRPMEEALQDLSNAFDQPLLIDKKSLEDLGLADLKKGVSLQAKGLSGRTVLRSILATQGLTFVVKDETIQIVTVEKAKTLLTTRVYYLGDLAQGVGPFGGIEWGPFLNMQQTQANVAALIDAIRKVDPLSWAGPDTGGAGTIVYHAPSQSIIVRNSAEVHHTPGSDDQSSRHTPCAVALPQVSRRHTACAYYFEGIQVPSSSQMAYVVCFPFSNCLGRPVGLRASSAATTSAAWSTNRPIQVNATRNRLRVTGRLPPVLGLRFRNDSLSLAARPTGRSENRTRKTEHGLHVAILPHPRRVRAPHHLRGGADPHVRRRPRAAFAGGRARGRRDRLAQPPQRADRHGDRRDADVLHRRRTADALGGGLLLHPRRRTPPRRRQRRPRAGAGRVLPHQGGVQVATGERRGVSPPVVFNANHRRAYAAPLAKRLMPG